VDGEARALITPMKPSTLALLSLPVVLTLSFPWCAPGLEAASPRTDDAHAVPDDAELGVAHREAFSRLELDTAIRLAEQQLDARRRTLRENDPAIADTLDDLAKYLGREPDYDAAESRAREAVAIRRANPDEPALARSLRGLTQILHDAGKLEEAESVAREALSRLPAEPEPEAGEVSGATIELAMVLVGQSRYAEAEALLHTVLGSIPAGDGARAVEARALRWLAQTLLGLDELERAERAAKRSLAIRRELHPEPALEVAESLDLLLEVFHLQRFPEDALACAEEALAIRRRLLSAEHPMIVADLHNVAVIKMSQRQFAEAEPLLREVLAAEQRQLGLGHPDVAVTMFTLGINLSEQGRYEEAQPLYREALAKLKAVSEDHPDIGWVLNYWARDAAKRGDLETAETLFKETHAFNLRVGDRDSWDLAWRIAQIRAQQKDYVGAEEWLLQAEEKFEERRPGFGQGTRGAAVRTPYTTLALVQLELGKTREAWISIEQTRGRVLRELVAERFGRPAGLPPVDEPLAGFVYSPERVRSRLDSGTAIVGWVDDTLYEGELRSWAYVLRSSGSVRWVRLDCGEAKTEPERHAPITRFRESIVEPEGSAFAPSAPSEAYVTAARELGRQRFVPLVPLLEGVSRLVVVPSAVMEGVPLEALFDAEDRPVGDRYLVSYAPSATMWAWLRESPARESRPTRALLVGDPPFRDEHLVAMSRGAEQTTSDPEPSVDRSVLLRAVEGDRQALGSLPRLAWSRHEVERIAGSLSETAVLLGPTASEKRITGLAVSDDLGGFDIIHFATHALVDRQRPYCSALVLSQLERDDTDAASCEEPANDGRLTGAEIAAQWELTADLVTLSACETGLGRGMDSGEGVIGFAYPFLQTGARSVLVSLWKVDDRATALFMERFYDEWLQGESKAAALRNARKWLRRYEDEDGDLPFAHPFYSSAFVLIGRAD